MTAADRPTVTDDARAEAVRIIDSSVPDDVPGYRIRYAEKAADALIERGLLAAGCAETTTATTEEWAHRLENGGAMIWPTREQAEADREDYLSRPRDPFEPRPPASAGIWRREVTDWTEADQ